MAAAPLIANLVLPGSGLIVRGRIGLGLALVAAAALAASLVALGLAGVPGFDGACLLRSAAAYFALGGAATLGGWAVERGSRLDPVAVRAAHDEAAAAWLRGEAATALAAALRVARLAPQEPGAWDLLALIAGSAGDATVATRAQRRARALERRAALT